MLAPAEISSEADLLGAVIEHAATGVILIDAGGRIRIFNPACATMFGYAVAEIIGQDASILMPGRVRHARDGGVADLTSTSFGRRKDGSTFPMELSVVGNERDGELLFVSIIQDLAGRPLPGEAAHDKEQNYRQLVERVSDYAIYMLDVSGNVSSWNAGARQIKQFSADEIIGHHFRIFYTPEERAAGEPERNLEIAQRDGRFATSAWRVRKDGSRFWANVVIEPLRDETGKLVGFAKVTSDITERRETELKIRETGERINAVIETVVDGVIQIDRLGTIQAFNPASLKLFGYRTEEVIGQNVGGLILQPGGDARQSCDEAGLRRIIAGSREAEGRRKDGSSFPISLSFGEARQDGEPVFVIIIHDLSEHKRTQEQLVQAQKMEIVGQLSGGIAHDFNNLLTVIVGNAEFLAEQLGDRHDLKQLADDIGNAGERGAELTKRLLAFSRRQMLQPASFDCNGLLGSMQKLLARTLRADIEIRAELDADLIPAFADPSQLESAIFNLALNAQDAMPAGGCLTLTTSNATFDGDFQGLHPEVLPGHYIMISVMDDGEGMTKEVAERVFEPFYTTKEVGKGSGLGLSMVYGFIKQSNGHVSIHSQPGLGTTVRMYLPQMVSRLLQFSEKPGDDDAALPRGAESVLVVEDDPFVRSLAVMRLKSLGYAVITAVDAKDALRKLRSDAKIDVLFSDIVMPGGTNGWELSELARQIRPGLPVLLTSGYALETLVKQGRLQQGAVVLTKPYRKEMLALRLREVLLVGASAGSSPERVTALPTRIQAVI
jgi:PAS domain S-box-containing protein